MDASPAHSQQSRPCSFRGGQQGVPSVAFGGERSSPGAALAYGVPRNRDAGEEAGQPPQPQGGRLTSQPLFLPGQSQGLGGLQHRQRNVWDQHRHLSLPATLHSPGTKKKGCSQLCNKNNSHFCLKVTYLLLLTFTPKIITNEQYFSLL